MSSPGLTRPTSHISPTETRIEPPPDSAPVPYANTNYLWTPEPGQAVSQLNAHIEYLRRQRQKVATEAEYMFVLSLQDSIMCPIVSS